MESTPSLECEKNLGSRGWAKEETRREKSSRSLWERAWLPFSVQSQQVLTLLVAAF